MAAVSVKRSITHWKANHCSELCMPKWPMLNYQNIIYIRYIHLLTSTFYIEAFIVFLITRFKRKSICVQTNVSFLNVSVEMGLSEVAKLFDKSTLLQLKNECGGLQTLLRNHYYIFKGKSSVKISKQGFL